ncbi:IS21-like element helper ATPase IstB [Kangiella sp. TOML190]|uniref:IS21-like element helper ATPase IstB n=1 Tax=Kangiella sp. TOML190 TaxID=2931351 RepID=UPI00203C119C|nr:IS21-like element helper ATPase IstB [Kangiella sp. TOML190]
MNSNDIEAQFAEAKMPAAKEHYKLLVRSPDYHRIPTNEVIFQLLEAELVHRKRTKFERDLKASKIKYTTAVTENIIFDSRRNLDRNVLLPLALCEWVKFHQNVVVIGLTGVGKTHIVSWLGIEAIKQGYRVAFKRLSTLIDELEQARNEGESLQYRKKIARFPILIIDDFGLAKLTAPSRRDLLEIIEDKTGTGSILITSQMPVEKWHQYIGDPAIADAILDRLIHKAHIIEIQGESMRRDTKH